MAKENNARPAMGMGGGFHGGMGRGGVVEKSKDFKGTLNKVILYLKPYYGRLTSILILTLFSTVFAIFGPWILGLAIDKIVEGYTFKMNTIPHTGIDFASVIRILLILLGIYLLSAIFNYIVEYVMAGIAQKIVRQMRNDLASKLHHLPLNYFASQTHGEVLSRVTNDIDTISNTFQQSLVQIISSVVMLIGILAMMLIISPLLTLVAILTLPLGILTAIFISKKSQKYYSGQQRVLGELNGHIEEMFGGHSIIKAFNYEVNSIATFRQTNDSLYAHGWKAQFVSSVIFPILNFVGNITFVGISVLGGYLVAIGSISLGSIQAFINYSRQFNQPIAQVATIANILQSTIAAAERVFEILEEKEEIPDPATPIVVGNPIGKVQFNDIFFRYDPEKPLIESVNIDVKPGQLIAVVGPTGAGKTTLVNLLMRFYELDKGFISVDGVKTTDMTRKNLHLLFGMVLQDTWLFKGTIRENIAYGKENATEEEILRASKMALADNFIRTLPEGYNTVINEEANNISEGEKQLLTIARAVIANPKILILDEATSSVDSRTEILIQHAMNQLMKGRTSFVIAHRLSTIRDADCILVMRDGQIIEQGNHQDLLQEKGFYYELYNSQFSEIAGV